jgi:hypothetical protein
MTAKPAFPPARQTTPTLSAWADVLVALAGATLIPAATPVLPLVPVFVLWPRWADRLRNAYRQRPTLQFVPDPLAPDWRQLGRAIADACQRVVAESQPLTLHLASFCRPDGSPRPYVVDLLPKRQILSIHEHGTHRAVEQRLPFVLRPRLPLPITVGGEPVALLFERMPAAAEPQIRLSQCATDPVAQSLLPAMLLTLMLALVDPRLSGVAAIAMLSPLAARAGRGSPAPGLWRPFRRSRPIVSHPAATLRFDLLRLWVAALAIVRFAAADSALGAALQDPLRLLFWGLMLPFVLHEGTGRYRAWRQRCTCRPS